MTDFKSPSNTLLLDCLSNSGHTALNIIRNGVLHEFFVKARVVFALRSVHGPVVASIFCSHGAGASNLAVPMFRRPSNTPSPPWPLFFIHFLPCSCPSGKRAGNAELAVGPALSGRPPHISVRAELPHTAPTLDDDWQKTHVRVCTAMDSPMQIVDPLFEADREFSPRLAIDTR